MKIVSFTGGLGNQLFEYLFYQQLSRRYRHVYGYYRQSRLGINGLELQQWFDVQLPTATWYSNFLAAAYKILMKLHLCHPTDEDTYTDGSRGFFFESFFQGRRFHEESDIQQLTFRPFELSDTNKRALSLIQSVESVAIHVRRGDYMLTENYKVLGNICTEEYYRLAVKKIQTLVSNPHYFVFSDDIDWCRAHFDYLERVEFIDWNVGKNSFYDMYLMSKCRHHIIANSTFSYWSARISTSDGITIYPERWLWGWDAPDIFPDSWKGILT